MCQKFSLFPFSVINVKFEFESYSVSEGEEADVCVIFETEQLKKDIQVSVVSHSDTANIGEDYNMLSVLPLTLKPDTNRSCFAVDTVEDNLVEGEETFQLILTSSDQAVLISTTHTLTLHIEDNDGELASGYLCKCYQFSCSFFIWSVATFGLGGAMYIVAENEEFIVSIHLLENELAVPISLEIKTLDISAS